jgi:hypothetical protein
MPGLLTTAAVMTCPHGGTVQGTPSSQKALAGGAPVLTASDLFVIAGCPFVLGPAPHPCVSVQWVQPAARSTKGGNPTLTMESVGMCVAADQAVQGTVLIASTQQSASGQ